jgi:hypothetical protein
MVLGVGHVHYLLVMEQVGIHVLREKLAVIVRCLVLPIQAEVLIRAIHALVHLRWHHHEHLGLLSLLLEFLFPQLAHLSFLLRQFRLNKAQLVDLELDYLVDKLNILIQKLQLPVRELVLADHFLAVIAHGSRRHSLLNYLGHLLQVHIDPSDDEFHLF